jgi:endonuclease/exonuclease/phosphatase (EEP) superfamily protein YafD
VDVIRYLYELLALAGVVVALASVVAARSGAWGHVGAQLAALRGPMGLAHVGAATLGSVIGAWFAVTMSGLVGMALLAAASPVGVRRSAGASSVPAAAAHITLVTANVLVHNDQFAALVRRLLDERADVLLLQEVTPAHAAVLDELIRVRPTLRLLAEPREDYSGWAIVTRLPVTSIGRIDVPGWPIASAVLEHPLTPIRVVNVHTPAPQSTHDQSIWEVQLSALAGFSDLTVPTVLAGDFNATNDHRAFRRLLTGGFADAFERVGRGWGATWPAHRFVVPVLRLDHVLVDQALEVTALEEFGLHGSDHRGLRAVLAPSSLRDATSTTTARAGVAVGPESPASLPGTDLGEAPTVGLSTSPRRVRLQPDGG